MRIKHFLVPLFAYLGFMLVMSQSVAQDASADITQRICSNLANETQRVLADTSTTTKYLSPYIATEIYQQVVAKSLAGAETAVPTMAALPCGDTVSDFMMAIKKRMEYNRVDHLIANNRVQFYGCLVLLLIGGFIFVRRRRRLSRQDHAEVTS